MPKPDDSDFNRGTPLFYCPVCDQLQGGWVCELARDRHMLRQHPEVEFPEGSGLAEWHAFREDTPVRSREISKLLRVETPRDYFDRQSEGRCGSER